MTRELLLALGEANLAAAAAVCLALTLRRPARRLFGATAAYALWALVPAAMAATLLPARVVSIGEPTAIGGGAWNGALEATAAFGSTATGPTLLAAALALWILGAVGMAALLASQQMRFLADIDRGVAGPAVLGFLSPRMVTPADFEARFEPEERELVLAHERVHLDRFDAQANALTAILRCVCWFNPFVHWGAHAMRLDQELACDAAVIARHPEARRRYAEALLKTQLAVRPLPIGCTWPAGTRHPLTERIAMLKRSLPSLPRRLAAGA
ncbi:MAG: M56 family metallopeptidase, partial [Maricaulaceae bacterium]